MGRPPDTLWGAPTGSVLASRTAAVIVAYRPNLEELEQVLRRALAQVSLVVVFDNDPDRNEQLSVRKLVERVSGEFDDNRVRLLSQGSNLGLSKAYNASVKVAREAGAVHLLLLDQDSQLEPFAVDHALKHAAAISNRFPVGAMSCTNIEEVSMTLPIDLVLDALRTAHYTKRFPNQERPDAGEVNEIPTFTNSGTILPVQLIESLGGFDESLFLDAIDYEFSLRLRSHGLVIFKAADAQVLHRQGEPFQTSLLGHRVELRSFPPERTYHIVRDTLLFCKRWWTVFPAVVGGIFTSLLLNNLGAVALLPNRAKRLERIIQAVSDMGHGRRTLPLPP